MRTYWWSVVTVALTGFLAGCASVPEPLRGDFESLQPSAAADDDIGTRVRWGGRLLDVTPERERTCFEILASPLDRVARPRSEDASGRRFLACRDDFIEPAGFPEGRLITVTGTLTGFEQGSVGDYDYRYPVISLSGVYLWSDRVEQRYRDPYPYHYPYWRYDPFYRPPPRYYPPD